MAEGFVHSAGGSGVDSSDCTADKSKVLSGYTAVTSDSDGEAVAGTMPDNSSRTSNGNVPGISSAYSQIPTREGTNLQINTDTDGTSRISLEPPKGYYSGGGACYVNRPASDFGTATAAQVLSGCTFTSTAGLKVNGTMANRGGYQEACSYYEWTNSSGDPRLCVLFPSGAYTDTRDVNGTLCSEAQFSAWKLGNAAAAQVRSGYSASSGNGFCFSGTLAVTSAISFSAAATSYNTIRISWTNPSKGPWQGVFIQISTSGYPGTGGGSRAYTGTGTNGSAASGSNYCDITGLTPGTTYYFTCTSYCDALGWGTSYNVMATTRAITVEDILSGKWSTSSSMTAELIYGSKYYMYNRYLEKISENHIYTTNNQHYSRGASHSSATYSYFDIYDLSGVTQTQVDQLNTYFNRINTYKTNGTAYTDTVYKSGITVSFTLVSSTQIRVNIGTKGVFHSVGAIHVYFYKA